MKRRNFLECCILTLAAAAVKAKGVNFETEEAVSKRLKFGIISDIHPDIMHDGAQRLQVFLDAAVKNKVDFIIELGDFCFAKSSNVPFRDLWDKFPGDKYHVLGNHDMDICTKEEYMEFVGMKNRYYSFDKGDFHFIVLDPNNLFVDGKYIPYKNGNFYVDMSQREHLDPEQIEWLKKDLAATDKRCILFSHECFENTVQNRELVRGILEAENQRCGFKKVIVAFSGHDHTNYTKEINGITYIQINSASNQWVGEEYACPERFSEEINKQHPSLKYTVPYTDSLYAIVTLTPSSLKMKGCESTFIAPTPADIGIPDTLYPFPLVPWIKDFSLQIK